MAKLADFYSLIEPAVAGCPTPLIDTAIVVAARKFCKDTGIYQSTDTQSTRAGVTDYDVDVPTGARLGGVLGVWVGGKPIGPCATDDVSSGGAIGAVAPERGVPTGYFQKTPAEPTLSLYPAPATDGTNDLAIRATFVLAHDVTELPDFLYEDFCEVIADGALAHIHSTPGTPFTSGTQAQVRKASFTSGIADAKSIARAGRVRRTMRVTPRRFP